MNEQYIVFPKFQTFNSLNRGVEAPLFTNMLKEEIKQRLDDKYDELRLRIERAMLLYLSQELLFSKLPARELKEKYLEEQDPESRVMKAARDLIDEIDYTLTDS